jgi:hypothetical protein
MNISGIGAYNAPKIVPDGSVADSRTAGTGTNGDITSGGDVISLSAQAQLSKSAFPTDDDYKAYQSVLAQGQSDPYQLVNAHNVLDPERVQRLLGLS